MQETIPTLPIKAFQYTCPTTTDDIPAENEKQLHPPDEAKIS